MRGSLLASILFLFFTTKVFSQTATAPSVGDGSSGNPYQIATLNNLYWVTQNSAQWTKYFIQTSNIDATTSSSWAAGAGFSPIGNSTTAFTGVYDGNGFQINNIYINRPSNNNIGFFGKTATGAQISNLGLVGINIRGQQFLGGLVGYMGGGTVTKCFTTGTITSTYDGSSYGGLVGLVWGSSGNTLIKQSYSAVNLTTAGYNLGGLVGGNWGSATSAIIEDCYSLGSVTRIAVSVNDWTGAFCGNNEGKISRCYSTGNVYYNSGAAPTGKGFIGGTLGTVADNFWDNDASNQSTAIGATSKTTAEMKTQSTFTNWDFSTPVWSIGAGVNNGYPYLQTSLTLPVSWLSFTGRAIHGDVELNWSTASELNNSHFEIERSANAINFSTIGSVAAGANPSVVNNYQYLDASPLIGTSYYRLKQVDIDGKYSFSSIIQINGTQLSEIKIYSDAEVLHVLVPASVSGPSVAFIYDAAGRLMQKQQVLPGRNIISTAGLSGGNYFLQLVNSGKNIYSNQFVK